MPAEWIVIRLDAAHPGGYERYQTDGKTGEGMPKLLELEAARQIQRQLNTIEDTPSRVRMGGEDFWRVNHYVTLTPPNEHQDWLNRGGKVRTCEHCGNPVRP
jgi:hypothetical protein